MKQVWITDLRFTHGWACTVIFPSITIHILEFWVYSQLSERLQAIWCVFFLFGCFFHSRKPPPPSPVVLYELSKGALAKSFKVTFRDVLPGDCAWGLQISLDSKCQFNPRKKCVLIHGMLSESSGLQLWYSYCLHLLLVFSQPNTPTMHRSFVLQVWHCPDVSG